MSYRDYILGLAPAWLKGPAGSQWLAAFGEALDALLETDRSAARLKIAADSNTGEPAHDTLDAQAGERLLERSRMPDGPSDASWIQRVRGAWEAWRYAGTAFGLLQALSDLGYPTARVCIPNGRLYRLVGGALNITTLPAGSWSTGPGAWNAYQIIFPADALPSQVTGAVTNWASGTPLSNSPEIEAIRRVVRRWQPAHARCLSIVAITAGGVWGYPVGQLWAVSGDTWDTTDATTEYTA